MDRWAALSVFGPVRTSDLRPGPQWQHAAASEAYARHLVKYGTAVWGADLSVHQLDQKAMNLAMTASPLPSGWQYSDLPTRT